MFTLRQLMISFSFVAIAQGCATVAPYDRGTLARTDMQLERNADAAAGQQHADAYREGSVGGTGASGGGCGCN